MEGVLAVPDSDLTGEAEKWMKFLARKLKKPSFYRFCETVLSLSGDQINWFKRLCLGIDDAHYIIEKKLLEDKNLAVLFLRRHRDKIKSVEVRTWIDTTSHHGSGLGQRSFNSVPQNVLGPALYEILDEIPPKDRRGFLSRELGIQPNAIDEFRQCAVDRDLMKDMIKWWWTEKAGKDAALLRVTKEKAEIFLVDSLGDKAM